MQTLEVGGAHLQGLHGPVVWRRAHTVFSSQLEVHQQLHAETHRA